MENLSKSSDENFDINKIFLDKIIQKIFSEVYIIMNNLLHGSYSDYILEDHVYYLKSYFRIINLDVSEKITNFFLTLFITHFSKIIRNNTNISINIYFHLKDTIFVLTQCYFKEFVKKNIFTPIVISLIDMIYSLFTILSDKDYEEFYFLIANNEVFNQQMLNSMLNENEKNMRSLVIKGLISYLYDNYDDLS